jgi:hypothetical protein
MQSMQVNKINYPLLEEGVRKSGRKFTDINKLVINP